MDNEDRVEGIEVGNEFHDILQQLNSQYGRGEVVSITWSKECMPDSLSAGMAVCQLQYGMCARPFRVLHAKDGYTVLYARHQRTVKSDYFIPF